MSQIQTNSIGSCTLILEALRDCCTQLGSLQGHGGLHVQLTEKREGEEREGGKERENHLLSLSHYIISLSQVLSIYFLNFHPSPAKFCHFYFVIFILHTRELKLRGEATRSRSHIN